jgi:hypothetical protein
MTTSAALPTHDHVTEVPVAAIPAQRQAPPSETRDPEPAVLPRQRPAAVLGALAGMAVGAAGTLAAAAIMAAPAVVPAPADVPRQVPEPRVAFDGTVSVPGRELTAFGDGTWQIGVDVVPGTYATTGGVECYHSLRPAVTGQDIARMAVVHGPATVVLAEDGGWITTSGCGTWSRTG